LSQLSLQATDDPFKILSKARASPEKLQQRHCIQDMTQSELVDYSINDDDLAFVKDRNVAPQLLLEFQSHLRTAAGPESAVDITHYIAKGTAGWVFKVTVKKTGESKAMKLLRMTQIGSGVKEWYVSKLLRSMALKNIVYTEPSVFVLSRNAAPPLVADQLQNAGPV
jgi:hypothetical protein